MARGRRQSRGKKINPTLFIFCEGETEESYVNLLKSVYRLPSIHIHAKIGRNNITAGYIKNYKRDKPTHEKDLTFLMYDLDVPNMLEKLSGIEDSILLVSNPCVELWYLLHYKNQTASTNSADCCREMTNRNKTYKKGIIDSKLKAKLIDKANMAIKRSKKLNKHNNPSTTVFRLLETLIDLKGN